MNAWWIRILRHASVPKRLMLTVAVLGGGVNLLAVLAPWPMKLLVDGVLKPTTDAQRWNQWLVLLPGASSSKTVLVGWIASMGVVLFCLAQIVRAFKMYVLTGLGSRLAYSL